MPFGPGPRVEASSPTCRGIRALRLLGRSQPGDQEGSLVPGVAAAIHSNCWVPVTALKGRRLQSLLYRLVFLENVFADRRSLVPVFQAGYWPVGVSGESSPGRGSR